MYRIVIVLIRKLLEQGKSMRRSQIEEFDVPSGRILFLGDSITEQGVWSEWFPEWEVLNRGIGGDTVGGVSTRLQHAINEPIAISLLIGTNDLSGLGESTKVPDIAEQMRALVAQIRARAPQALLVINSVMPRQRKYAPKVRELNSHYRAIAGEAGAIFVDLWPAMEGPRGQLSKKFSEDNLHLSGPGYRAWVDQLRPLIAGAVPSN